MLNFIIFRHLIVVLKINKVMKNVIKNTFMCRRFRNPFRDFAVSGGYLVLRILWSVGVRCQGLVAAPPNEHMAVHLLELWAAGGPPPLRRCPQYPRPSQPPGWENGRTSGCSVECGHPPRKDDVREYWPVPPTSSDWCCRRPACVCLAGILPGRRLLHWHLVPRYSGLPRTRSLLN